MVKKGFPLSVKIYIIFMIPIDIKTQDVPYRTENRKDVVPRKL